MVKVAEWSNFPYAKTKPTNIEKYKTLSYLCSQSSDVAEVYDEEIEDELIKSDEILTYFKHEDFFDFSINPSKLISEAKDLIIEYALYEDDWDDAGSESINEIYLEYANNFIEMISKNIFKNKSYLNLNKIYVEPYEDGTLSVNIKTNIKNYYYYFDDKLLENKMLKIEEDSNHVFKEYEIEYGDDNLEKEFYRIII